MKKTLWIAILGVFSASVIAASAQVVQSANVIGRITKTMPAGGKYILVTIPFDSPIEAENVFGRTSIAQDAPVNSWVQFWNGHSWEGDTKTTKGWLVKGNRVVQPGEFFFMHGDTNDPLPREITIVGKIPTDNTRTRAITGGGNLNSVANPFPTDFKFGSSPIALQASVNSFVQFWAGTTWVGGGKSTKGWGNLSNRIVRMGEGFFMKEVNSGYIWSSDRPYNWP